MKLIATIDLQSKVIKGEYALLLSMNQWKVKRNAILARDDCKCRKCNSNANLNVHHRQYHICKITGLKKQPWQYQNRYLITLCRTCHVKGHQLFNIPTFTI